MRQTLRWLASASRQELDPRPWRTELFPEQQRFFDDPSRRKAALCTRRAGKTRVNGAGLLDAIVTHPQAVALYLTLTQSISYDMLWSELTIANERWNLGLTPSVSDNSFYSPQGGAIVLGGCKDIREAEKYRGNKYSVVVIDEGGTHKSETLKYLIEGALSAATTDYDASIWLTGTPGPVPKGYFWAVTENGDTQENIKPWVTHRWTASQNPFHKFGRDPEALERERIELGFPKDHPFWLREYCGQWALDESELVYPFSEDRNGWNGVLPNGHRRTILGMDLGSKSATTFIVTTSIDGVVYVREAIARPHMMLDGMAGIIKHLKSEYPELREVYVDHGALGDTIMQQMTRDYGVPVQRAQKTEKAGTILRAQTALYSGRIKVHREKCRPLLDEWLVLPWDKDHQDHRDGFADHCSDGFLYSFKMQPMREPVRPVQGPESIDQYNAKVREQMMAAAMKRSSKSGKRW